MHVVYRMHAVSEELDGVPDSCKPHRLDLGN